MAAAPDRLLRMAAFNAVKALTAVRGELSSTDLKAGFEYEGQRIPLVNPQRGIFKPQQMRHLLSIRTVYPKPGPRSGRYPTGLPAFPPTPSSRRATRIVAEASSNIRVA